MPDDVLKDVLLQVPLALAVLIIFWAMFRQQNKLDTEREKNKASDEQARNEQLSRMIEYQAGTVAATNNLRDALLGAEKSRADQLARLEVLQTDTRAALDLLRHGWEDNTTALTALSKDMEFKFGETIKISQETQAAAQAAVERGDTLYNLLKKLDAGQTTIIAAVEQLLKNGVTADAVKALTDEMGQLRKLTAQLGERLPPAPGALLQ